MTRKEAIARIKDHMFVHKIYEKRAVKIAEALNMAISVLEQPEIIRCKDCTHWNRESICDGFCSKDCMRHDEDFYCGYAERKINE